MKMRGLVLFAFWCGTVASAADVIPAARRYAWEAGVTVGVPGGIPTNRSNSIDVTSAPYNADNTGATDAAPAVDSALAAAIAGGNDVVYMPAGTYRFNSGIGIPDNMTLRGAGMGVTNILYYGAAGSAVVLSASSVDEPAFHWPSETLVGSYVKGDTTVTYGNAGLATFIDDRVGKLIKIDLLNDTALPVVSTRGYERVRTQMVRIVSADSGTLSFTFYPPLAFDLPASLIPQFSFSASPPAVIALTQREFAGLEDLTIDGANATTTSALTGMGAAYGCWMKNIEVKNTPNYLVSVSTSLQCEIRHSYIHDRNATGSNGAGILPGYMSNCLVEDNIINNMFPGIEQNFGSTGNVYAYNYIDESASFGVIGFSFNSNHGPHSSYNLWEGNIGPIFQSDGYFGGDSEETLFRNWFHGSSNVASGNHWPVRINRFSRNFNVVGNLMGRTGVGLTWIYTNTGPGHDTTSTTSNSIGTGSKVFTVAAGLIADPAGSIYLAYSASSPTNWMTGRVNSYSGTTLDVQMARINGSGTFTDWTLIGGTGYGNPVTLVIGGPNIGNGGFLGDYVLGAAQSLGVWWRVWDGIQMVRPGGIVNGNQPNTPYDSGSVYTTGEVVDHNADGPFPTTGNAGIIAWIARNPAKDGLATWDTPNAASADWQPISSNSFQELDYDAYSTAIIKGNWNASTVGIPSNEALGGATYPNSYFRTSAPAFFGSIAWPPIDPTNAPSDQTTNEIAFASRLPAAWRFLNGNENYLGATTAYTPRKMRILR